jgi:hypothetical protein
VSQRVLDLAPIDITIESDERADSVAHLRPWAQSNRDGAMRKALPGH